jgi:dipeptidyl aminopeptidase/acylaminoacyl peptidase
MSPPGSASALTVRDLYGMTDPFAPEERARIIAESPLFQMERFRTPTLLQFGAHSLATRIGGPLYGALQRLEIPAEFLVYDEGHVTQRPAAAVDELTRLADWFDYWLRNLPYPDAARAKAYDAWRNAHTPPRAALQP